MAAWALLFLGAAPVRGQDEATFVSLGPVGLGRVDGRTGYAVHAAIGHRFGPSVVTGRAAAVVVDDDAGFLWDDAWDIGVLYGWTFGGEGAPLSLSAGPACVGGSVRDESGTFGLALEGQLLGRFSRKVAAGVCVFGNVNGRSRFWGATVTVRFDFL
jgi:hypothetical protein